jgi:PIN domain nuclease of toxin-antitoxin system
MRLLIDTQIVLKLLRQSLSKDAPAIARRLLDPSTAAYASVASLWEIAIKTRLGKLEPGMPLEDIAGFLQAVGLGLLSIEAGHVVAAAEPEPDTRDPFDRLLLAQCEVENLRLVTLDRALVGHRLALKI